jgi:thiamine biosynthesis lipoprotein
MTAVHQPSAAISWQRISTGDDTVAVAERAALGTTARLAVWPPENLNAATGAVDIVLSVLDRQASRFREDSEISWVNRSEGGRFMLSDGFAEAASVALEAARWTGGLADPTVGDAFILLGYDRDFAAIDPDRGEAPGVPGPAPGWQTVRLDGGGFSPPAAPGVASAEPALHTSTASAQRLGARLAPGPFSNPA